MSIARVNKYGPHLWNYNKDPLSNPLNNDNGRMLESQSQTTSLQRVEVSRADLEASCKGVFEEGEQQESQKKGW